MSWVGFLILGWWGIVLCPVSSAVSSARCPRPSFAAQCPMSLDVQCPVSCAHVQCPHQLSDVRSKPTQTIAPDSRVADVRERRVYTAEAGRSGPGWHRQTGSLPAGGGSPHVPVGLPGVTSRPGRWHGAMLCEVP